MRLSAFLFALGLIAIVAFGASLSSQQSPGLPAGNLRVVPGISDSLRGYNSSRMWRRAEIRVVPLEQVDSNKAELQSLRKRVSLAETQSAAYWFSDPAARTQMNEQLQLMRDLLKFSEQLQANNAKNPTAIEVERRLNQIQGQTMCEACHSGIVARNGSAP